MKSEKFTEYQPHDHKPLLKLQKGCDDLCSIIKYDEQEKMVILQAYRAADIKEQKGMMMYIFGKK